MYVDDFSVVENEGAARWSIRHSYYMLASYKPVSVQIEPEIPLEDCIEGQRQFYQFVNELYLAMYREPEKYRIDSEKYDCYMKSDEYKNRKGKFMVEKQHCQDSKESSLRNQFQQSIHFYFKFLYEMGCQGEIDPERYCLRFDHKGYEAVVKDSNLPKIRKDQKERINLLYERELEFHDTEEEIIITCRNYPKMFLGLLVLCRAPENKYKYMNYLRLDYKRYGNPIPGYEDVIETLPLEKSWVIQSMMVTLKDLPYKIAMKPLRNINSDFQWKMEIKLKGKSCIGFYTDVGRLLLCIYFNDSKNITAMAESLQNTDTELFQWFCSHIPERLCKCPNNRWVVLGAERRRICGMSSRLDVSLPEKDDIEKCIKILCKFRNIELPSLEVHNKVGEDMKSNKGNRKILDVNEPMVRTYTHDADYLAIVTADSIREEEAVVSNMKWNFEGKEKGAYSISEKYCKVSDRTEQNLLYIGMSEVTDEGQKSAFLYNKVSGTGTFTVCVEHFRKNAFASQAGIMVVLDSVEERKQYFKFAFLSSNRIYLNYGVDPFEEKSFKIGNRIKYLRVTVTEEGLKCECSEDGETWNAVFCLEINICNQKFSIGFYVQPKENNFEHWFYSNYIQLHCSEHLDDYMDVPLTFYSAVNKEFRYLLKNPWIEQDPVKWNVLKKYVNILDFVKDLIDNQYYIELHLDEFYIEKRQAYQKYHNPHGNMIYGYDQDEKKLYLLGYDENRVFYKSTVSYKAFVQAFENVPEEVLDMFTMKRLFPCIEYKMQKDVVKKYLQEYLDGTDSSYRDDLLSNQLGRLYGVNIYTALTNNVDKLDDYRNIFLLVEHKKIMKDRVAFMNRIGMLTNEQYEKLDIKATEILKLFVKMKNMTLKYCFKSTEKMKEKLLAHYNEAKEMDIAFVKEFISYL